MDTRRHARMRQECRYVGGWVGKIWYVLQLLYMVDGWVVGVPVGGLLVSRSSWRSFGAAAYHS